MRRPRSSDRKAPHPHDDITLGVPDPHSYLPGAKTPSTLPEILNHDELVRLFTVTTNPKHRSVLITDQFVA